MDATLLIYRCFIFVSVQKEICIPAKLNVLCLFCSIELSMLGCQLLGFNHVAVIYTISSCLNYLLKTKSNLIHFTAGYFHSCFDLIEMKCFTFFPRLDPTESIKVDALK